MYIDQTGKFPHRSIRGNRYQVILQEIDCKSTWIEPMKNKTEGGMILSWHRSLERMKEQGILPTHQLMDNEISTAYVLEIKETSMTYQIVHPYDHHHNMAEKSIQTWKNHFLGLVSGTEESLPAHLRCQSIPQAEQQLLLLI